MQMTFFNNGGKASVIRLFEYCLFIVLLGFGPFPARALQGTDPFPFDLQYGERGISSLKKTNDVYNTDYLLEGWELGNVKVRFRLAGETDWRSLSLGARDGEQGGAARRSDDNRFTAVARQSGLVLSIRFRPQGDHLVWNIRLRNENDRPVEIGDVALPLPMNHDWSWDPDITYNKRVVRHSMISGHNSFLYWMRSNTVGPYLLMTPVDDTHLEYFDQSTPNEEGRPIYTVYVHSKAREEVIEQQGGSWRQSHTGVKLGAAGHTNDRWSAGFKLQWADGYDAVRQKLYAEGLFNIYTVPGMTVPRELPVKIALRNRYPIHRVRSEFPEQTAVRYLEETSEGYHIYQVKFGKLGENKLVVDYGDERRFQLEYFVTEPIETLINKRAAFLVERQQIRAPDKWYDGLLSDWSMKDEWLLTPENIRDIPKGRRYMISSDDPALSRPSFLAKKNVSYPVQEEVQTLDRYIAHFVWGGLQMTDREAYPYAIYGIHNWKMNRESSDPGQYGRTHIWRIYDYPHIIQMYISMYRIARYHPSVETALEPEAYLQRAYGTAVAFYNVPEEVIGWSPYHTGNYNELAILDVIEELEKAGQTMRANRLRQHWEKKVATFVNGEVNLFGSEYSYDTTGFESTGAFARYAMEVAGRPDKEHDLLPLAVSRDSARQFMEQQVAVNVGTRGWLEKAYYLYGSDYRGSGNAKYLLSYMAQMGGWSLFDYSLYFADNPYRYLRLSYGSLLSSWALMNTGTPESNYGYWYPGKINDGGAGGGFEPMAYATNWLELRQGRGAWYYGCEIDLGFTGYLRAAATVLADDPIFGMTALGGSFERAGQTYRITPADGVRRRLHLLWDRHRVHIRLRYDRFKSDTPVTVSRTFGRITFALESDSPRAHPAHLAIEGLGPGRYIVTLDGQTVSRYELDGSQPLSVSLPVQKGSGRVEINRLN